MNDPIEQEIQAKVLTAPRVTLPRGRSRVSSASYRTSML